MSASIWTSILIIFFLSFNACKKKTPPPANIENTIAYTHFTFHYTKYDTDKIGQINQLLEDNYAQILAHHGLAQVDHITFYFFETVADLRLEVHKKYPSIYIPDYAGGLTPSATEVYLISQNLPGFTRDYKDIVHEFAHCVSQSLNPSIPNNPRWLWESVAIYEANQFVDPATLDYMVAQTPPNLDELSSFSSTRIYQVGFLISEFIISEWGILKYKDLIAANGNITTVLGISKTVFEQRWFDFVKTKYHI